MSVFIHFSFISTERGLPVVVSIAVPKQTAAAPIAKAPRKPRASPIPPAAITGIVNNFLAIVTPTRVECW